MEEQIDYERLEGEVRKIRWNLDNTEMSRAKRLMLLNIMRYNLGLIEDRDKVKKVIYDVRDKKLKYSESVEIGIAIAVTINEEIRKAESVEEQTNLYKAMQETYYYLARYLFEYFLIAMEFGIPAEEQFIAPRACVLNKVARQYTILRYRTDRPVMTVSMPQRNGKNRDWEKISCVEYWIRSE